MSGLRFSCPACGRFVAEAAIVEERRIDPGAYYGFTASSTTNCPHCGPVEGFRISTWGDDQ